MNKIHKYNGKKYRVTDAEIHNGDLVLTENYGVWIFQDFTGTGSAPMPYWANKKTCKKLELIIEDGKGKRIE